jgi:tetratricopeptide (TPR) repeat protein
MDAYAEAAKLRPDDPALWLNLAAAAKAAGSYGRAVVAARRAAALAPRQPVVWERLGELMLDLHRLSHRPEHLAEAIKAWKQSLTLDPNQPKLVERVKMYEEARRTDAIRP